MNSGLHISRFQNLASILHILSDEYALEILDKAQVGFKSGKGAIRDLKLTPRQYYRKLKELNEYGILTLIGEEYKLTQLGAFLHRLLLNDVSGLLRTNQNSSFPIEKVSNISQVGVIDDYNKLRDFLIAAIEKSKSEILLATRYLDLAVIQSLVYALDRNVRVRTVTSSKVDLAGVFKLLGDALLNIRPNMMKFLIGRGNYKTGDVSFSLMVIDNEIAVFEIPNKQFKSAFVCVDKQTVRTLAGVFSELWNQSEAMHILPS